MIFCVNNWDLKLRMLSIQQKFQFEILEIPCSQWNVHFHLHRPNLSLCAFHYFTRKQYTVTKEQYTRNNKA